MLTGCATTGGFTGGSSQTQNTAAATYSIVRKLDAKMDGSITQLNETTAGLDARMAETDRQSRELLGRVEETQMRLEQLQMKLDELTRIVCQQFGVTAPSTGYSSVMPPAGLASGPATGDVIITPPDQPTTTAAPPVDVAQPPQTLSEGGGNATEDYKRARGLYDAADYEKASQELAAYVERYPSSEYASYAQFWYAQCFVKLGRFQEAINQFQVLRTKYPTSSKIPIAMCNEAIAYANLGKTAEATTLFEKLIAEYPNDPASEAAQDSLKKLKGVN